MPEASFKKLEDLYNSLPGVPCLAGCTGCCVSPTMTLLEFIYLMQYCGEHLEKEELKKLIMQPIRSHPRFEGNFYCRFQTSKGECSVHPQRALACRMHGLPVIEKLGVSNMENCTIMDSSFLPNIPVTEAKSWLQQLMEFNTDILPEYGEDFYRLIGLNVECWLDILFVDELSHPLLRELQNVLRENIHYQGLVSDYHPQTEIFEKFNSISLLELIIQTGEREPVLQLLSKIEKDYPTTGNYFQSEVQWMKEKISETTKD